jgi:hypothetical protein
MIRRNFLSSLMSAVALDPERLLWVPGAKTISIPKPRIRLMLYTGMSRVGDEWGLSRESPTLGVCLESEMDVVRYLHYNVRFGVLPYKGNERRYEVMRGATRTIYDPRVPPTPAALYRIS